MSVVGIVPAGGSGERLGSGGPKAFVALGGRPLVLWAIDAIRPVAERVIVAVPPASAQSPVPSAQVVVGGSSRSRSVRNAVDAAPEATVFIVHDAARPLATSDLVARCLDGLGDADGAIAAAPVTDTIKEAADGRVVRTLDRSALWAVQTPQVFRADVLRRALDVDDDALAGATDDASLVEAVGGSVRVVDAPPENLKVTTPLDLRLAEALLAH